MPALSKVEEIEKLQTFLHVKYFKPHAIFLEKAQLAPTVFSVSSYVLVLRFGTVLQIHFQQFIWGGLVWQSTLYTEGIYIESSKGHPLYKDTHLMYLAFHDHTLNEVMLGVTQ